MTKKKRICTVIAALAVVCALCAGGFLIWKKAGSGGSKSGRKVYVQKVSDLNTVSEFSLADCVFSGVVEAQESADVKYDSSKTIDEILVKDGDSVKKGDKLVTYDVEAIELQLEQAKLEVERLKNEIESNKNQISELEKEKKTAGEDAAVSYTTQILSLQSDNSKNEYDIKAKNVEIKKLEASTKKAYVTAPIDGTVKNVKSPDVLQYEGGDIIMQITAEGDYRIKGSVNEQNIHNVMQDLPVIIRSRLDDTVWKGEITSVDTSPKADTEDMYDYMESDEMTSSSNYSFYVKPESLDGFMLGQHVLIEPDNGQSGTVEKTGIWLYSDFVCKDGNKSYVWAKDEDGEIEKRYVEIGERDEENGDCEIRSGLSGDDYIAYPDSSIEEGMTATTNEADVSVAPNDLETGREDMEYSEDYETYDEGTGDMDMDMEDGGFGLDEEMLESMTDEEIEAYLSSLYGDEFAGDEPGADGEEPAEAAE